MPDYVTIGAKSCNKDIPQGAFTACYIKNGTQTKGKQVAIHLHNEDTAYEMIEDWAQITAKENGCELRLHTQPALSQRIRSNSNRKGGKYVPGRSEFDVWNHKKFAHLFINNAVKLHGVKLVKERLDYFLEHFAEVAEEEIKIQVKQDEADILHANALYDVFVKTGIDMLPSVNSKEVKELYISLRSKGE